MPLPCGRPSSRRRLLLLAILAAAAAAAAGSSVARAQPRAGGPQPRAGGPPFQKLADEDGTGTIDAIGPGVIRLRLKGGEFWTVVPAPNAEIEVVGTATREMLQAGQFIVCSLEIDATGKVLAPVTQITFTGGGMPGVVAGGLGIADPAARRVAGRRPAGTYLVSGPIRLVTDSMITVQAGKDRFEIEVPAETELLVRMDTCGLATPGDQVEVEGLYVRKGELQATSLLIKLANPVSPPAKKGIPRRPVKPAEKPGE